MSSGTLEPATSSPQHNDSGQSDITFYDSAWQVRWQQYQQGVLRYNCADSLDRTNAASYFAAVQVRSDVAKLRLSMAAHRRRDAFGDRQLGACAT